MGYYIEARKIGDENSWPYYVTGIKEHPFCYRDYWYHKSFHSVEEAEKCIHSLNAHDIVYGIFPETWEVKARFIKKYGRKHLRDDELFEEWIYFTEDVEPEYRKGLEHDFDYIMKYYLDHTHKSLRYYLSFLWNNRRYIYKYYIGEHYLWKHFC